MSSSAQLNTNTRKFSMKQYYKEYAYTRMPCGKYKGFYLKDIPDDYLKWAAINWQDRSTATMFRIELTRRNVKVV